MLLVIDNYDSFTYNLVQYLQELGAEVWVVRNDAVDLATIQSLAPTHIVISPGPGRPETAGITLEVIRRFAATPTLGVCLGHQAIAHAFGARIDRARNLMHGKTSKIWHDGQTIFGGLPSPFTATRYHSLLVAPDSLPPCLKVSAWTEDGEVMGVRHKHYPLEGVQFHPESILSEHGKSLLANFLQLRREERRTCSEKSSSG